MRDNYTASGHEETLFSLLDQMRINELRNAEVEGRDYRMHGLCAILGYDPKEHSSYVRLKVGKDLFQDQEVYLQDSKALDALEKAMEIDGAILIGKDGKLMHSGRYILSDLEKVYSMNEKALATYAQLQETSDAGTRHIAAIALSAQRPELLIYTLKSDYPQLRVFRGGSIVRSTVPGEVKPELQAPYKALELEY